MQTSPEMSEKKLSGRIAIVTGATSGIGRGIAQLFACQGAKVLLTGRDEARGQAAIEEIAGMGVPRDNLAFFSADLCDAAACQVIVAQAMQTFGALDILVNNAADTSRGDLENTSLELWDRLMAINLRAPFVLMQAALPHLKERGGSIVNIGSVNAYVGETKLLAYSATKGGLMTLTKNAAADLRRYRVRVNVINVGWTLTEGEDRVMRQDTGREDWLQAAEQTRPFGRLLLPADVARAALFFASDDSALVTGSALDLEQNPVGARNT
ncbi:MAG: hypothetical protein JWN98_194 [Abditibacteriota bacterium]|nr:hypothetical protein [Abditibacteriota bacterium]